jgi:hypothetical protein
MTLSQKSDSDDHGHLEDSLTPAERYVYARARRQPDEPFCFLDFKNKYTHGTMRNVFSSLRKKGLIRLYCRSSDAFYVLLSGKPKWHRGKVTLYRGGGCETCLF